MKTPVTPSTAARATAGGVPGPRSPRGERAGVPGGSRPGRRISRHLPLSPWLFAAPGLLVVGAFSLYPFFSTLVNAFTDRRTLVPGTFVGLDNFQELLHDEMFWIGLRNSTLPPARRTRARHPPAAAGDARPTADPRASPFPFRLLHPGRRLGGRRGV